MPYYPPATGGGGTPGGSDKQVQFNDAGSFGGDAGLTYDKVNAILSVGTFSAGSSGSIVAPSGDSLVPTGLNLRITSGSGDSIGGGYGGTLTLSGGDGFGTGGGGTVSVSGGSANGTEQGGNINLFAGGSNSGLGGDIQIYPGSGISSLGAILMGPTTVDPTRQDAVFNDNGVLTFSGYPGALSASSMKPWIRWIAVPGSVVPSMTGASIVQSGFTWSSLVGTATTNAATRGARANGSTAATAASTAVYTHSTSVYAGFGDIWVDMLTGIGTNTTGYQCFCGIASISTALAGDPSALTNMIGFGFDAADLSSGNWQFYCNDGSGTATKIDTGIPRATTATSAVHIFIHQRPSTTTWDVAFTDIVSGAQYTNSVSSNTPVSGTKVASYQSIRNGAIAAAAILAFYDGVMQWAYA